MSQVYGIMGEVPSFLVKAHFPRCVSAFWASSFSCSSLYGYYLVFSLHVLMIFASADTNLGWRILLCKVFLLFSLGFWLVVLVSVLPSPQIHCFVTTHVAMTINSCDVGFMVICRKKLSCSTSQDTRSLPSGLCFSILATKLCLGWAGRSCAFFSGQYPFTWKWQHIPCNNDC